MTWRFSDSGRLRWPTGSDKTGTGTLAISRIRPFSLALREPVPVLSETASPSGGKLGTSPAVDGNGREANSPAKSGPWTRRGPATSPDEDIVHFPWRAPSQSPSCRGPSRRNEAFRRRAEPHPPVAVAIPVYLHLWDRYVGCERDRVSCCPPGDFVRRMARQARIQNPLDPGMAIKKLRDRLAECLPSVAR
jgi:hypothetical protein